MDFINDPSLALYLPLHRLDGASFISKDGYGHLAAVTGVRWTPQGRSFDGVDDWISVPNHAAIDVSAGEHLTLELWFRPGNLTGSHRLAVKRAGGAKGYMLLTSGAGVQFATDKADDGTGDVTSNSTSVLVVDTFYHVVATYDGATQYLYINAQLEDSDAQSGDFSNSEDLNIGRHAVVGQYFAGIIGEFRIYSRALSAPEVQHNYVATKWRY
ncbi:MAG: LamG domain-containing protein [Chloroflexi bacterium]|nr:LamG domain-containing protein [Chloroflexota bacterium]